MPYDLMLEALGGLTPAERDTLSTQCVALVDSGRSALRVAGFSYMTAYGFRDEIEEAMTPVVGAGSDILDHVFVPFEVGAMEDPGRMQEVVSRLIEVADAADVLNSSSSSSPPGTPPRAQAPSWFRKHQAPDFVWVVRGAVLAIPMRQWVSSLASWAADAGRWVLARRIGGLSGIRTFMVAVVLGVLIFVVGSIVSAVLIPLLFPPPPP